jgi:hypothetical protein
MGTKISSDLSQFRALYVLRRLSSTLCSDVLEDGEIAKRFGIPTHSRVEINEDVIMSQSALLEAVRNLPHGSGSCRLRDESGHEFSAEIIIDVHGDAIFKMDEQEFQLEHAGLLVSNASKRLDYLSEKIARCTLTRQVVEELRKEAGRSDFTDEDKVFLSTVAALNSTHEAFSRALLPKAKAGRLTLEDLLPSEMRYWEQLTAPAGSSRSLEEFSANELLSQRKFLLEGDLRKAFRSISLSFCAPALVPRELFATLDADRVLVMLEEAVALPDHFGLVGAFEICGDMLPRDSRFEAVGKRLLDRLFADKNRLEGACWIYSGAFVLATARLHQHEEFRQRPAFWRRLTAAAHASVIVRILAEGKIDGRSFFNWAVDISGKAYSFSVALDAVDEPRWRADWLGPSVLVPDAFGRCKTIFDRFGKDCGSPGWADGMRGALILLGERGLLLTLYPAIGESAGRPEPEPEVMGPYTELYRAFIAAPTVESFLQIGGLLFWVGVSSEAILSIRNLIMTLQQTPQKSWDDDLALRSVIALATYSAVLRRDAPLGELIADLLLDISSSGKEGESPGEITLRLVECTAADPDRLRGQQVLARRLETLSLGIERKHLKDVYHSLQILRSLNENLCGLIGKAAAAARMGRDSV